MSVCEDEMILEDFVMLGKTVPEPQSDGRVFVCSAGVSAELGTLLRIYPLARWSTPKRWQICHVPLERNPKDHRWESFKILGDRAPGAHERINRHFRVLGQATPTSRVPLLAPYVIASIKEGNDRRLSLGIIHPTAVDLDFEYNPGSPLSPQLRLFEAEEPPPEVGAKRFPYIPRLWFRDEDSDHHLMLRDWGCYEFMRKHDRDYYLAKMADSLNLTPESALLVGNQNNRRTSWLVISVLNGLRSAPTLFSPEDTRPGSRGTVR